jgi:hypothetical protein
MGVIMSFLRSFFVAIFDLFRDKDSQNKLSKGAILLWITFGFLCFFWVRYALMLDPTKPVPNMLPDAPESLMAIFITLLLYIVFPKRSDLSDLLLGLFNRKQMEIVNATETDKLKGINVNNGDEDRSSIGNTKSE